MIGETTKVSQTSSVHRVWNRMVPICAAGYISCFSNGHQLFAWPCGHRPKAPSSGGCSAILRVRFLALLPRQDTILGQWIPQEVADEEAASGNRVKSKSEPKKSPVKRNWSDNNQKGRS